MNQYSLLARLTEVSNVDALSFLSYAVLMLLILVGALGVALVLGGGLKPLKPAIFALLVGLLVIPLGGPFVVDTALRTFKFGLVPFKSTDSVTKAMVDFINKSDRAINLYWIDHRGVLTPYPGLNVNDHYEQQTYVGHRWLITDSKDRPIAMYTVSAPKSLISFSTPRLKVEIKNDSVCETNVPC